jgi:hypothetical protein
MEVIRIFLGKWNSFVLNIRKNYFYLNKSRKLNLISNTYTNERKLKKYQLWISNFYHPSFSILYTTAELPVFTHSLKSMKYIIHFFMDETNDKMAYLCLCLVGS